MRREIVVSLLLSVAAVSCRTPPTVVAESRETSVRLEPDACVRVETPMSQSGMRKLALESPAPAVVTVFAEATALSWERPASLALFAGPDRKLCAACFESDAGLDCDSLELRNRETVTIEAGGLPNLPPGFAVTLVLCE